MIGLREDRLERAKLVLQINQLFSVASGAVVASGLAPRWAAQRPQKSWERFALQRGASPLATTSPSPQQPHLSQEIVLQPIKLAVVFPASKAAG